MTSEPTELIGPCPHCGVTPTDQPLHAAWHRELGRSLDTTRALALEALGELGANQ